MTADQNFSNFQCKKWEKSVIPFRLKNADFKRKIPFELLTSQNGSFGKIRLMINRSNPFFYIKPSYILLLIP